VTRPKSMVLHEDGREFFTKYELPAKINLIAEDPPYNIGVKYASHDDDLPAAEYLEFLHANFAPAIDNLADDGQVAIYLPFKYTTDLVMMMRGFGLHLRDQPIWGFTFGQHNAGGLTRSYIPIHVFSKLKTRRTMNVDDPDVRVPSDRQLTYNDKRANPKGKTPTDIWVLKGQELKDQFGPDMDVWIESRICGTFKERNKLIANQLPIAITDRLVRLLTNPGDWVYDGFCGSGTHGESAIRLGRNFVGCDIDQETADFAKARIRKAKELYIP
jgi:DNA modification methylase